MTTNTKHDARSITTDARRVLDAAQQDAADKRFGAYVHKADLTALLHDIEHAEAGIGARAAALHAQVAAGVQSASIRARIASTIEQTRAKAHLEFPSDVEMQRAFGVGVKLSVGSSASCEDVADSLLAAAQKHAAEAKRVGLDAHGIHDLEALVHALRGADLAHVHVESERHTDRTLTDALLHKISAEVAWIRRAAHYAFAGDEAKLARYAHTLPRHAIVPATHVTPPAPPQP